MMVTWKIVLEISHVHNQWSAHMYAQNYTLQVRWSWSYIIQGKWVGPRQAKILEWTARALHNP